MKIHVGTTARGGDEGAFASVQRQREPSRAAHLLSTILSHRRQIQKRRYSYLCEHRPSLQIDTLVQSGEDLDLFGEAIRDT